MYPSAVDVKHDAEVDRYTAQHCKTVDKGPVGGIQRDLTNESGEDGERSAGYLDKEKKSWCKDCGFNDFNNLLNTDITFSFSLYCTLTFMNQFIYIILNLC